MSGRYVELPPPQLAWLQALRKSEVALTWPLDEWQRVVRLARQQRLLARLAESVIGAGLIDQVPLQVRRHLLAEQRLSRWRTAATLWTLERVATMLDDAPYPRVLLKGGAYIGQDLPIAAGRLPSDLDILVPQAHVRDAQARLKQAGWREAELDEHDRRYYHEWSHEVPPMTHSLFALELDLHHNILPPVARTRVDASMLLQRLRPSKWSGWMVLDPLDQVLHSAVHLLHDSELRDRIRDLADLDGLLRHFSGSPDFIARLPERAKALGLQEPLALACRLCVSWFGTPIPADVLEQIESMGPGRLRQSWLLPLLETVLMPTEPDELPPLRQDIAAMVLLARHHRQRMPLRLLLPHLWHKLRVSRGTGRDGASEVATGGPRPQGKGP